MGATFRFHLATLREDSAAVRRLLEDPNHPKWQTIARQIGAVLVATAQRAFREQRLGDVQWPQRYPQQTSAPYVNVAGLVADLGRGQKPPKRRFEPRPALMDTGELRGSVDSDRAMVLEPFSVVVRSDRPYSLTQQEGGISTLLVDTKVRYGLMKFLRKRKDLRARLGWLFQTNYEDVLETKVNPRPFLGVTDDARRKILRIVEHNLEGRPWESRAPQTS